MTLEISVILRGRSGVGKTHYLKKIADLLREDGFDLSFNYGTGIEFLRATHSSVTKASKLG